MKTTKTVQVIIEQKDLKPLFEKAVAGVGGTAIASIRMRGSRPDGWSEGKESANTLEIELFVTVEEEIK